MLRAIIPCCTICGIQLHRNEEMLRDLARAHVPTAPRFLNITDDDGESDEEDDLPAFYGEIVRGECGHVYHYSCVKFESLMA